ncbi:Desert hedgehog protein A [Araneus ventricosus]|uniref:Hedgehog protein n=1 Tax=Araneus ventricosus TaxID=182803 RepID=A0A4Y2BFL0_ARAVE|nr:Desert hedgehog protein A [Araneus ventricosus]
MLQQESHRVCRIRKKHLLLVVCLSLVWSGAHPCGPGRSGARRRSIRKLTPLVFKQHVPNVPENSIGASGQSEDRIRRGDPRFKELVLNYNPDIVYRDKKGTGADRVMTQRLKEKLDNLAISVMNQWPSVRLRVTEGFDEDGLHAPASLHYSGRAVDITTSDRDLSKYGMLARLAVEAGFDWVYFESRSHIHCSVKKESAVPIKSIGCFHGSSVVSTRKGPKKIMDLEEGDEVASGFHEDGQIFYSQIVAFLHTDRDLQTVFVRLETDSGNILFLTQTHLIFRWMNHSTEATFAFLVEEGDLIYTKSKTDNFTLTFVTSATLVTMKGVYAPLTDSGTILVNGVWVSCYAEVASHDVAHAVLFPLRLIHVIKSFVITFYRNFWDNWRFLSCISSEGHVNTNGLLTRKFIQEGIHWYPGILCWIFGSYF